jgi:CRP-like cAMP-binding protein
VTTDIDSPLEDPAPSFGLPLGMLTPAATAAFTGLLRRQEVAAGSIVFRQGELAQGLHVVREGTLAVEHLTPDGRSVTIRLAVPGSVVGLVATLTGNPHQLLARALEAAVLDFGPRSDFLAFLDDHPRLARNLLQRVSRRVESLERDCFEASGNYPLAERLLGKLEGLARHTGRPTPDGMALDLPLTVQTLANLLGCSRQWTSKVLGEMEQSGLIRRSRERIVLLSPGVES